MLRSIAYTVVSAFASTNGPDKSHPPRLTPPLQDDIGAPQSYVIDAWIGGYACCDCGWEGPTAMASVIRRPRRGAPLRRNQAPFRVLTSGD
ncbi:MAG: hypothetical protein K2X52_18840 [Mycobacteriaceae bacterium]|nr:hypothetical protein [Mycobacteriaceae bacterium]